MPEHARAEKQSAAAAAAGPRRRRMSAPAGLLEERLSVPKSKILADHKVKVGPADTCASLHVALELARASTAVQVALPMVRIFY